MENLQIEYMLILKNQEMKKHYMKHLDSINLLKKLVDSINLSTYFIALKFYADNVILKLCHKEI